MTKQAFKKASCFMPNLASGNNRGFVQLNFQIFASKSCSVGCDYSLVNVTLEKSKWAGLQDPDLCKQLAIRHFINQRARFKEKKKNQSHAG